MTIQYKSILKENLYNLRFKLIKSGDMQNIKYFDKYILEIDLIDDINEIKRIIYHHMTLSNNDSLTILNKKYYNLYQELKSNNINLVEAIESFKNIFGG